MEGFEYHEECQPDDARVYVVSTNTMQLVNDHVDKSTQPGWWFGAFFASDPPVIFLTEGLRANQLIWDTLVNHEFNHLREWKETGKVTHA